MIDSHVHFWKYNPEEFPWIDGSLEVIAKDMLPRDLWPTLASKIEGVIAVQARPCLAENEFLLHLAEKEALIQGVMACFDFDKDHDLQLEKYKENQKIKGFRYLLQDEKNPSDFMKNNKNFNRGIKKIQEKELLYSVLIQQKDLAASIDFCKEHDRYELILDHLAKPVMHSKSAFDSWKKLLKQLAAMPHVNLKISGLVTEGGCNSKADDFQDHINTVMAYFGPERLLWGSDWPVSYATHDYSTVMRFWDEWTKDWTASERLQVETNTAKRLYKL